jgi:hypothetical protein
MTAVGNGLSFVAELAQAVGGTGASAPDSGKGTGGAAQAAIKLRTDELRERIGRQLAAAGINLSQPVELTSNGQGGIAVAGPHPQQAAIEDVLGSDVLLERDFNQLAGDYSQLAETNGAGDLPPTLTIAVAQASPLVH